jgi:hypothetical protein
MKEYPSTAALGKNVVRREHEFFFAEGLPRVVLCFCYPWRLSPGHPDTAALKQIKRSAV